jgi:hypothetical protein
MSECQTLAQRGDYLPDLPSPSGGYSRAGLTPGSTIIPPEQCWDPLPTASFTEDVSSGTAPLTVQFANTSTGHWHYLEWSFGDGHYSQDLSPSHTYPNPGTFSVALELRNFSGASYAYATKTVNAPGPPIGTDCTYVIHNKQPLYTLATIAGWPDWSAVLNGLYHCLQPAGLPCQHQSYDHTPQHGEDGQLNDRIFVQVTMYGPTRYGVYRKWLSAPYDMMLSHTLTPWYSYNIPESWFGGSTCTLAPYTPP